MEVNMSTRSMVAIKQADGKFLGMWKHWDGSPTFMLSLLNQAIFVIMFSVFNIFFNA